MGCFHSKHLEEPTVVEVIKGEPVDDPDYPDHRNYDHDHDAHDDRYESDVVHTNPIDQDYPLDYPVSHHHSAVQDEPLERGDPIDHDDHIPHVDRVDQDGRLVYDDRVGRDDWVDYDDRVRNDRNSEDRRRDSRRRESKRDDPSRNDSRHESRRDDLSRHDSRRGGGRDDLGRYGSKRESGRDDLSRYGSSRRDYRRDDERRRDSRRRDDRDRDRDYRSRDYADDRRRQDYYDRDRGRREYDAPPEDVEQVVDAALDQIGEAAEDLSRPIEDAGRKIRKRLHHLYFPKCYEGGRPSFYAAYARAARRYGFASEAGRYAGFCMKDNKLVKLRGDTRDIDHEVPAESVQNDSEYVVPVKVGTPAVTVYLDFDTGSSDLWIWSCELAEVSKHHFKSHHIYSPRHSETARQEEGSTWQISYGDGSSASGDVYEDVVSVAGVTIPHQSVECARELSSAFLADGGNDGLLGLGWPKLNTVEPDKVKTPMENMIEQGVIDEPIFTVMLGGKGQSGFYSFGHIDKSVTSHRLHYTDVDNSRGFWQVDSQSYSLKEKIYERRRNTAILDTGTSLLLTDEKTLEHIYGKIDGATYDDDQGGWKYPNDARIPEVSFAVGDYLFRIHRENFGFGPAGEGYTLGGLQSRGDQDFDIFGDVFLKNVYVVFNQGEKSVGVALRD